MKNGYNIFLTSLWAILFMVTLNLTGTIEGKLFPVVKDFRVSQVVKGDGKIWIHGSFYKARSCGFRNLDGFISDEDMGLRSEVVIEFQGGEKIRGVGVERYGPWQLNITGPQLATLEFESAHTCHALWQTVTKIDPVLINLDLSEHPAYTEENPVKF